MNETSYIKVNCNKVIELARELIKWREDRLLKEFNQAYQDFCALPLSKPKWWAKLFFWVEKGAIIYDKNEKVEGFIDFGDLQKSHSSIYLWVKNYRRRYSGLFACWFTTDSYFERDYCIADYVKILKLAQFSLDNNEKVMFLGEKDARILGIC